MKIAVCISGQCVSKNAKTSIQKNNRLAKKKFPQADFFYSTWETNRKTFERSLPEESCLFLPEPEITYHPYKLPQDKWVSNRYKDAARFILNNPKRAQWASHHVKQHLAHAWLVDSIPEEYDLIIRIRYDTWISKKANFDDLIKQSWVKHIAIGVSATKKEKFDELNKFDTSPKGKHYQWLTDQMIIHPRLILNKENVELLFKEKSLHPAEMGWYQILSWPLNNHECYDGWVNHDKNVLDKFFYEI